MTTHRIEQLDDRWERQSIRSQRALLTAERDTLEQLNDATRRATEGLLLAIAVQRNSETTKLQALAAVQRVAEAYRIDAAAIVRQGRGAARAAALERVAGELEAAAAQLGAEPFTAPPPSDAAEDIALGQSSGDSLSSAWRAGVAAAVLAWADNPRNSLSERVREVTRAHLYRRQRIATTDIARAFNDEHGEAARWVAQQYTPSGVRRLWNGRVDPAALAAAEARRLGITPEEYQARHAFGRTLTRRERERRALRRGPDGIPFLPDEDVVDAVEARPSKPTAVPAADGASGVDGLPPWAQPLVGRLVQRWEAKLDIRTCKFCHAMNGAITLIGKPWPNGYEPGMPHPNCRCLSTIIVLTPQSILENEKRAPLKARAVLQAERQVIAQDVQRLADQRALIRVKR